MYQIVLDRDYYSHSQRIFDHLKEHFQSEYTSWRGFPYQDKRWNVSQVFGITTVCFAEKFELKMFEDWVKTL